MKYLKIIVCVILALICVSLLSPLLAFVACILGVVGGTFGFMILWDKIAKKVEERWNL